MSEAQAHFEFLLDQMIKRPGLAKGRMMSSPAIKAKGKVFAFFHNDRMTFRLGKDFDPDAAGLVDWRYLSPFKNKPPMTGWISVSFDQHDRWAQLAELAFERL